MADIKNSHLIKYPKTNTAELAQLYDYTRIDLHVPLVTKKISSKPTNPWMTRDILAFKRQVQISGACLALKSDCTKQART